MNFFIFLPLLMFTALAAPTPTPTLSIDNLKSDKPLVTFPHAKHLDFTVSGNQITCATCHHKSSCPAHPESCVTCHLTPSGNTPGLGTKSPEGKYDRNSVLYHKLCLDCHKKVKEETSKPVSSCITCHKPV